MHIKYGEGKTEFGPGVSIDLSPGDVELAIRAWLVGQDAHITGASTLTVNGAIVTRANVNVDPSGSVVYDGERYSGRGPSKLHADD